MHHDSKHYTNIMAIHNENPRILNTEMSVVR